MSEHALASTLGIVCRTSLIAASALIITGCPAPVPTGDVPSNSDVRDTGTSLDAGRDIGAVIDTGPDTFVLPDADPNSSPDVPYRPDVLTDGALAPVAECSAAPVLALNTRYEGIASSAAVAPAPSPASCWTGTVPAQLHYVVDVPPWTGIRVAADPMSGTSNPGVQLTDRCAPANGIDCEYLTSGTLSTQAYYGNANSVSRRLIVHVSFPSPDPATLIGIETQTWPLFPGSSCVGAPSLAPNMTITAPHGGSDRLCGVLAERSFYRLTVPPRSIVQSLTAATFEAFSDCGCSARPPLLRNDDAVARELLVAVRGGERVGWRAVALEPNSVCTGAVVITATMPDRGRRTDLAGLSGNVCSFTSVAPLYYKLDIPGRQRARVRVQLQSPNVDQGLQIWSQDSCGTACMGMTTTNTGGLITLDVDNLTSTTRNVIIGTSITGSLTPANLVDADVSFTAL